MSTWDLELSTAPTAEPLTVGDIIAHLNFDGTADDAVLQTYLSAAIAYVQRVGQVQLMTATYKLYLDRFHDTMMLPRPPCASVTSVKYLDQAGDEQTLAAANYLVNKVSTTNPAQITLAYNSTWPAVRNRQHNAITIEYVAGYTSADNVPEDYKQVIRAKVGALAEHREDVVVGMSGKVVVPEIGDALLPFVGFRAPWPEDDE